MQKVRRPSPETIIAASALALIAAVGGWAAGGWDTSTQHVAEATPTPGAAESGDPGMGAAPESDARAGMHDVCSRRVGCLLR